MQICNNSSYNEIISTIKSQTKISNFRDGMLAAHFLCRPLSRPFSVWFIHHNIKPNQITVLMIIFGIIGSILFALPSTVSKIIGYLFWILWFTMDLSDGQVARYTKTFSKYGTEMDYMAHLIDHPCMNLAIWLTFLQMNLMNPIFLSGIFMVLISLELIIRNIIAFKYFHSKLNSEAVVDITNTSGIIKYFFTQSFLFPSLIICYSWIIVIDYYLNIGFSLWLFIVWLSLRILLDVREVITTIKSFYR